METSHWISISLKSVRLHSSSRHWGLNYQMKCKLYFDLKRGLSNSPFLFLLIPGKLQAMPWISPKREWDLLCSLHEAPVIPVASAPFYHTVFFHLTSIKMHEHSSL
ncbi:hypothetical protein ILYODFUR_029928 [Ilyodon furcidens]|uniref:Uncharacterized protein n=1 Tax=Ilyodon furcidens TaxID=33524 RepID=A0ABV0UMG3_9TELE